jgi:hypothetical protein
MPKYLEPSSRGFRQPTSNEKMNGNIVNPPRMAEMGGLSSPRKSGAMAKNSMTIRPPGATVK